MAVTNRIFDLDVIEEKRLAIQALLDKAKPKAERNRLGQFATPTELARELVVYAKKLWADSQSRIRFLDPALGTGAFYTALLRTFPPSRIAWARGYEIDSEVVQSTAKLWANTPLELEIADFTQVSPPTQDGHRANLLICNPPYVRHHHLSVDEKARLQTLVMDKTGLRLNGLTGLYGYFLLIAHAWLSTDGLAGWLIPSEFMSVNYGEQLRRYLLQQVTLLHIHRFSPEDVQFDDALVSSAVVWFRKQTPDPHHKVTFSYGGTLADPRRSCQIPVADLSAQDKWLRLSDGRLVSPASNPIGTKSELADWFDIKRGLVTGANKFFILTQAQIAKHNLPRACFTPILPSPRHVPMGEIKADEDGIPLLARKLFLLTCNLPESVVRTKYPALWTYLQTGVREGIDQRYLCRHRSPWYAQENRPAAPFLCTYMGRQTTDGKTPFRFFLNHSEATAPNVYLMLYPKPILAQKLSADPELRSAIWQALRAIPSEALMHKGRVYGGGLYKIEPKELAAVPADGVAALLASENQKRPGQLSFFV